ncbi:GNAT family N-acetyltransferase [Salinisphaera sp. SPP-AMP-43]|uniref:GNAT family N-acetyltransferase n=1 Tax=Salinisphaera sp. SPP-AMP-43 TaxID=3121288 RepID=UPI003C6DB993
MDDIELIAADTPLLHAELAALAHVIWHQHYTPIIGEDQVRYMLDGGYNEAVLAEQQAAGTCFTLARRDDRFIAFAAVSPDPAEPSTAWLDKLYVLLEARNLGVGRRLVARAADQAAAAGADTLRLRVNRHNADSITAYQRLGFVVEYEDIKDIGQGYVMDDYVMAAPVATLQR